MKHKLLNPLRLLLVVICMLGIAAEGQEIMVGVVKYKLNPTTKTAKVVQSGELITQETVIIEPTLTYENEEYTVTEIDEYSLCPPYWNQRNTMKSIILPETIKKIGECAFLLTDIESITIPNSVDTIMQMAFQDCNKLKTIKLSESITVIPGGLFKGCSSLEEIEIPNSVQRFTTDMQDPNIDPAEMEEDMKFASDPYFYYAMGMAFQGCENLKTVFLSKHIKSIPLSTFQDCTNLTYCEIPQNDNFNFGFMCLQNCPIQEIEIPNNIYAFCDLAITPQASRFVKSYWEDPIPYAYFSDPNPTCPLYVPKGLSGIYNTAWTMWEGPIKEATPVELEGEWRTFCAYEDLDFSEVEGLEAYIAKEYQDGKVLMEPIEQVPAGTGVVLKGAPGFYEIPYPEQDEALEPVENLMVGLNYGERIQAETEDGQCNLFFNDATEMASLFYGPFMDSERAPRLNAEGEQPMFAPADGARLPYHRAYLQLPASEAGKTVEMVFGSLTGIKDVTAQPQTDGTIYNLQGQRVVNPGPGIYIQNGRKFVVR